MSVTVLHNYLIVGAVLFCLGAIGFVARRNLIVMILSGEMMLQGVALNLVAFGAHFRSFEGQAFIVFMLTVAACEAALALALILVLYRQRRSLDVSVWQDLREPGLEPVVDLEPLEEAHPVVVPVAYPRLTPAGRRPVPVPPSIPPLPEPAASTPTSQPPGEEARG